jgi:hypothetical protein
MRRRSTSRSGEDDGLAEPLLGGSGRGGGGGDGGGEDSAPPVRPSPAHPAHPLIPWRAPSAFFLALWDFLHLDHLWRAFASLLGPLLPRRLRPRPRPSARALAARDRLVAALAERFEPTRPAHASALAELWTVSFPGVPFPTPSDPASVAPHPAWREAGWQGDDPRTDLRGGGLAAVRAALTMASTEPGLWARLRHKDRGPGGYVADLEYPFGAGGVAVTVLAAQAAGLLGGTGAVALPAPPGPPASPGGRGFVALLDAVLVEGEDDDEHGDAEAAWAVWAGVYCAAYERLDDAWVFASATYMSFPALAAGVREQVEAVLAGGVTSVGQVRARLGLS